MAAACVLAAVRACGAGVPPATVGGGLVARLGLQLRSQPPLTGAAADSLWEADSVDSQVSGACSAGTQRGCQATRDREGFPAAVDCTELRGTVLLCHQPAGILALDLQQRQEEVGGGEPLASHAV